VRLNQKRGVPDQVMHTGLPGFSETAAAAVAGTLEKQGMDWSENWLVPVR
jgi:hypothetical protein